MGGIMTNSLRTHGDQRDEAQRFNASQAAREQTTLDLLSVYYVVKAHIEAGRIAEARAIVVSYRAELALLAQAAGR